MSNNDSNKKRRRRFIHDFLSIDINDEEQRSHMILVEHNSNGDILSMNIIDMPNVFYASRYHLYLN